MNTVLTIEEIKRRVAPVAKKYGLKEVYLFGSYARGEATPESDVDLLLDTEGAVFQTPLTMGAMFVDFEDALEKRMDVLTQKSISNADYRKRSFLFLYNLNKDKVKIYG